MIGVASAVTIPAGQAAVTAVGDLDHLYCCDEDVALCGIDLTGQPEVDNETSCVVCVDLDVPGFSCSPGCPNGESGDE